MATEIENDRPIAGYDDLLSLLHNAVKPESEYRIGAEMEKFGVFPDGTPVPYDGETGVLAILKHLSANGWKEERESEGGPLLALARDGASITLEPGSQFELSGAPLANVHEICSEFRGHLREISPISKELGITWLGLGFHPFSKIEDYTMVPKQRYSVMREYLPTRGKNALDMMLRTATVQANYDYSSEEDAMAKMRVGLKLAPLTAAMFANSPFYEGETFGGVSYRAKVWLDVDPDRSGLVPTLWNRKSKFVDYVEWALDVPMFMIRRNGERILNTGQAFRNFLKSGAQGHRALLSDWKTHLNTLFPEVRLKNTIEVRSADAQGASMACALPALWTGIYYDKKAFAEAEALTESWTLDDVTELRKQVWKSGIRSFFGGKPLQSVAERLLEIAEGGLERRAKLSSSGKDERVHLAKLKELVANAQCPADLIMGGLDHVANPRAEIIRRTDLGDG